MIPRLRAGDLLVAPPNIIDQRFDKTVMLVTHTNSRGSFALCVNKKTDHTVNDILEPMDMRIELNCPLYWGGPVHPNTVWMLHDNSWSVENSLPVNEKWAVTSHTDMFEKMINGDPPERFRIFYGHAAWGPGQLEGELRGEDPWKQEHSWLIVNNPDPEWMMLSDVEHLWTASCSISGQQAVESWLT
jgi:putative transcriptional regulator